MESLQPCHNLATTLSQPCHNLVVYSHPSATLQPHCLFLHKVVTSCHNLATTLSRPCSIFTTSLQPCSHIVYSFTRLSQGCHKLATTLSRPCSIFTIPLQPCNHIVYSFTRLSQALPQPCHDLVVYFIIPLQPCSHIVYSFTRLPPPHYNNAIISQAHYNLVTTISYFVTSVSQPCHNIVIFSPPHRKHVTYKIVIRLHMLI